MGHALIAAGAKGLVLFDLLEVILDSSGIGGVVGGDFVVQFSHGGHTPSRGDGHSSPAKENLLCVRHGSMFVL